MKRHVFAIILITGLCSCEKPKNYKCICRTESTSIFGGTTVETKTYTIRDKHRKAQKRCDNYEPDGIEIFSSTDCTLH